MVKKEVLGILYDLTLFLCAGSRPTLCAGWLLRKKHITCLCDEQLKGMFKRVHESLQGGRIGDVGLARPHLWQLLHLPRDLSQDLQRRTPSLSRAALKIEARLSTFSNRSAAHLDHRRMFVLTVPLCSR